MVDTAQAFAPAETDPIAEAASAFKAFTSGEPVGQPRDESGRFAPLQPEEPEAELEEEGDSPEPDGEDQAIDEDGEEAAEDAQPMPPSWPADKAAMWDALPADAKAFVAERDAEQLRASNAKFQEAANVRKAAEAEQAQAKTTREQLMQQIDLLSSVIQPVKPDPRAFGAGTGQYYREAYDLALAEYEQQSAALAQLTEQRAELTKQAQAEEESRFLEWKSQLEAEYQPKFLADVPELRDPAKAEPVLREMIEYAVSQGISADTFAPENHNYITSPELHILWKAQQYDKLRASPPQAKPKASPAVKPGVSSPRSAQKAVQRAKISERLAREGSVEAGAAMWKQILKG